MSQIGIIDIGNDLRFLTGNIGGFVGQDINDNINILGAGGVYVTGTPLTNTLTITYPLTFIPSIGVNVLPDALVHVNVLGGRNIQTEGTLNTLTIHVDGINNHAIPVGKPDGSLDSLAVGATGSTIMGTTGANPSWTGSPSFSGTVTAGTGVIVTAGNVALPNTNAAGTQGVISFGGTRWINNIGATNTFVGATSGNLALTTATSNTAVGANTMIALDSGLLNTALGTTSLAALTSGNYNIGIGSASLIALTTGTNNIALGYSSGTAASVASSSNILIGNVGAAESNTIRIGTQGNAPGQQVSAYMAGVYNTAVGATAGVVLADDVGKLGGLAGVIGEILIGGTKPSFLAAGTTGKYLRAITGGNPSWSGATIPDSFVKGDILTATAANVVGPITAVAAGSVLISNGIGDVAIWSATPTVTTITATTFRTGDPAAAATCVTLAGTTLTATGTDANVGVTVTAKGTGAINLTTNIPSNSVTPASGIVYRGIAAGGWSQSEWRTEQHTIQTANDTSTSILDIALVAGLMVSVKILINGFKSDFSECVGGEILATAFRDNAGGNTTLVGAPIINVNYSNAVDSSDIEADVSGQSLRLRVIGTAANWNWVATATYMYTISNV